MHRSLHANGFLAVTIAALLVCSQTPIDAQSPQDKFSGSHFGSLLSKRDGVTYEQIRAEFPTPRYLERISFDPTQAEYFDLAVSKLQLNETEQEIFRRYGFVSVDHDQRYSFPSMYYTIYVRDLPVFVTADSVLHALHRSYEEVLTDIELLHLMPTLQQMLSDCHDRLTAWRGAIRYRNEFA
jgi:hypothetical protein